MSPLPGGWRASLRHAFAVDPEGPAEPTPAQQPVVERLCAEVVRRRLTAPALLLLEMARPLNFLGAQLMHFLHPMATALLRGEAYTHLAAFLERRGAVEHLCRRLEELEGERARGVGLQTPPEGAA
ncbi:MAG: hypothetical protein AB1505_18355 [Candidatus Latescibacterota bacterium]